MRLQRTNCLEFVYGAKFQDTIRQFSVNDTCQIPNTCECTPVWDARMSVVKRATLLEMLSVILGEYVEKLISKGLKCVWFSTSTLIPGDFDQLVCF